MPHFFVSPEGPPSEERRPVKSLEDWVPRVYRFALRLTADTHAAEDLTQETMLRAWRGRHALRDERAARQWLFRIAVNLWRDRCRRWPLEKTEPLAGSETQPHASPEKCLADRDDLRRALDALNALPPRQREVLYLNAVEEMNSAEIAEVLGINRGAVKVNLSLARKAMREMFDE